MIDDGLFACAVALSAGILSGRGEQVEEDDIKHCVMYCYGVLGEAYEEIDASLED